jgi:hypothetical protein
MKTPTKTKGSARTAAEYTNEQLAESWLAWTAGGSARETATLGAAVDQLLRKQVPDGVFNGTMAGLEADVRQGSAELLFSSFLGGNAQLARATARRDLRRIAMEIKNSTYAAAKFGRGRCRQLRAKDAERCKLLAQAVAEGTFIEASPDGFGLPQEARLNLALAALAVAVQRGTIAKTSADMTSAFLTGEKLQEEIAGEQRVSAAAVSQRIKRTAEKVREIIASGEVEL